MSNFLDLSRKIEPSVKIIYRTVTTKQPWYFEVAKIVAVVAIVGTVVWGISKADEVITPQVIVKATAFSISGDISKIDADNITINSDTFGVSTIEKIETADYVQLTLTQLLPGDKVIAQGVTREGVSTLYRIISFGGGTTTPIVVDLAIATSTATTTLDFATTTVEVATTTATTTDTASSTEQIASSTPDIISTTTPEVIATTTTEVATTTATTTVTTTEEIVPDIATTTTTPEVIPPPPPTEIAPLPVTDTPTETATTS